MVRIMAAIAGLGLMLTQAQAVEIKLLASNALRSVLQDIAPQFEQASGHKLVMTFGSTGNLTASIDKGTAFDVTIMGADALDNLINAAHSRVHGSTLPAPVSASPNRARSAPNPTFPRPRRSRLRSWRQGQSASTCKAFRHPHAGRDREDGHFRRGPVEAQGTRRQRC
jgi:hypothetical protein